jgi:hypothetical protein
MKMMPGRTSATKLTRARRQAPKGLIKACMAVAVVLAGVLSGPVLVAGPALAVSPNDPSCPPSSPHSFVGWTWTASGNGESGIRAPVETSFKSLLCVPSSDGSFATGWIAIQESDGSGITQAGIIHEWINGASRWCRVWATGTGVQNYYDCGDQSDGTYVYFQIYQYSNTMGNYYLIEDCGTGGGYGNCSNGILSADQPAYSDPIGSLAAETNRPCTVQIMGSASAPQNYGTSASPVQGLVEDWETRDWDYQGEDDSCPSDYKGAQGSGLFSTWDTRN